MDRITRYITKTGGIMACAIDSTYMVATAQEIHQTSPVATAALGRLMTAASMMGSMLKKNGASVTLKVNGGGPLGSVVAIADSNGNCKGFVEHPEVTLPLKPNGKLDVGGAVGRNGLLGVLRDSGEGRPYSGQVALQSGEIAEDITHYYAVSEQIPTVCALGVLVGKDANQGILAGGLLVQVLPGAAPEEIDLLEKNAAGFPPVTKLLAQGMTIDEICLRILMGLEAEALDCFTVHYACNCSRERVKRAFSTLKEEELLSLPDETGLVEAKCQYCGKNYQFNREDLMNIVEAAKN